MTPDTLNLTLLLTSYIFHLLLALIRDGLRFASLGYLKATLEKRFQEESKRELYQIRMEKYFEDSGRNQRELEWATYFASAIFLLCSVNYYLNSDDAALSQQFHLIEIRDVYCFATIVLFIANFYLLRIFSEPFAEEVLFYFYPFWRIIHFIMSPFTWLLHYLQVGLLRIVGKSEEGDETEQKVLDSMSHGEKAGVIEGSEREMIENIIEFKDLSTSEVMTPRTDMVAVNVTSPLKEVVDKMIEESYSRILVFEENRDNIIGFLHVRDLMPYWGNHNQETPLTELMHKPMFVPETKKIRDLFQEFKSQHQHIAVVLDEYGGTAGLITIEDILEEIVGEIVDEHQEEEEQLYHSLTEKEITVNARMRITELNELFNQEIGEDGDYDSVGGWLISELGRIPTAGERGELVENLLHYHVLSADHRKIEMIKLSKTNGNEGE